MGGINSIQTRRFGKYNLPFHYDNILSGQMGRLIPIQCDEVNAGEYWNENVNFVMRMSPLIHPAMTQLDVHFYSFFVPTRIITPRNSAHSTWEKMIESLNKPSTEQPVLPSIFTSSPIILQDSTKQWLNSLFGVGTLSEYLDFLCLEKSSLDNATQFDIPYDKRLSIAGFLVYLSIYNYWFRRDQIEDEILCPLSVGGIDLFDLNQSEYVKNEEWTDTTQNGHADFRRWFTELFKLRYKNYERDYFTSALPEPQYGEDITVGDGTLVFDMLADPFMSVSGNAFLSPDGANMGPYDYALVRKFGEAYIGARELIQDSSGNSVLSPNTVATSFGIYPTESAGLSLNANELISQLTGTANTFTINELRLAMQMQAVCEVINRGGTRYVEIMQNVYNSIVPDARLQQPVFLGGTKFPVQIGAVVQSSQTSDSSALGTLAGKAQAANGGRLFRSKKKFDEAGYVMTIMCVSPRSGYAQGIPRKWLKKDVLDFFNPYFAHVGEQEVYNAELYFNPLESLENSFDTFGYQERYSEYRHAISRVHGEMRTTKDAWHLYRKFDQTPSLNTDFIKMDVDDFTRIFEYEEIADTSNEMFDMMIRFNIKKKTPVPKYGTPYSFI